MAEPAAAEAPQFLPIGPGLRLRRFDPDRAAPDLLAELLTWYQDLETVRLVDGPVAEPYDEERLLRMFRHLRDHGELYLVELRDGMEWRPVGDVTLQTWAVPIVLAPAVRGQGIGRTVIAAMIERARVLGQHAVDVSDIYDTNVASRRLFESLGFVAGERTELGRRYTLLIT
ncbi:GNAT family N-acetyltransferase [Microlunatus parietis]|uniref:RimJ/RimL family protein N-acetyltransferase n=1 Tax=Microlunatus parietis TaxID=682979 RepID=A0A7Y9LBY6_9ACTN|nr:GNAT family N-acetyltransferase [Microlunatus parietis]NYE71145.1 RimJ/RimL family protein N-acetyltransferase [Microlunatus parietis]